MEEDGEVEGGDVEDDDDEEGEGAADGADVGADLALDEAGLEPFDGALEGLLVGGREERAAAALGAPMDGGRVRLELLEAAVEAWAGKG